MQCAKLYNYGFRIPKDKIDEETINTIKKDLTFIPEVNPNYKQAGIFDSFYIYRESKDYITIPRFYGFNKWKLDPKDFDERLISKHIEIKYTKELRENQIPIINKSLKKLSDEGGIVISAPCGEGKTAMALNLICKLSKKTMIVVHNENLFEQWKERISFFTDTPVCDIGEIRGKVVNIDKNIVIAMLQTISMKNLPKNTFDDFGLICVDECHHIGAKVFSKALPKIASEFMIGLSATPNRKDGLSSVFFHYLGEIGYMKKLTRDYDVGVELIQMHNDKYKPIIIRGTINCVLMLSQLIKVRERNDFIVKKIKELVDQGREVLALTSRREHVMMISNELDRLNIENGKVMGAKNKKEKEDRENSYDKQVLVGTYNLVSEGFDCARLDTLVMMTPIKDVEQTVGRIMRKQSYGTNKPLIIDIIDEVKPFISQGASRKRFYKKHEKPTFVIKTQKVTFETTSHSDRDNVGECLL